MSRIAHLWEELQRRRVIRVALSYGAIVFALLQVVPVIQQSLRLPEWVTTLFVVLSLLGFPIAVILTWMADLHARGGRWIVVAATALVVGTALLGVRIAGRLEQTPAAASGPAPSASSSPAAVPTAITDFPPPATTNAEAADQYAAAMQLLRDGALGEGMAHLQRAADLDPGFAAARVHIVAAGTGLASTLDELRKDSAAAEERRGKLSERDAALLDVATADLGDVPDLEASWRRWKGLSERYPLDAEIAVLAGKSGLTLAHSQEGESLLDRAASLDPKFAWPYVVRAVYLRDANDLDGVLTVVDKCLAASPRALACLRRRTEIRAVRGDCGGVEQDARTMLAVAPGAQFGYDWLAVALVSQGAPIASVVEADRRCGELVNDASQKMLRGALDTSFIESLLQGDFARAARRFAEWDKLAAASTSSLEVSSLLEYELAVFREQGASDRMLVVAEEYTKRMPALLQDDPVGFAPDALAIRHRAGRLSDAEFRATRGSSIARARTALDPRAANRVWEAFYAGSAFTAEDARDALDALPRYSPLPSSDLSAAFSLDEDLGRVYVLAGRPADALPHLRRAVATCFNPASISVHVAASEELGEALEATGDAPGACAAYAEVLARWGNAKPRSITADAARAHAKKLGCAQR